MKTILQYFDEVDRAFLTSTKLKEEDIIIDMRIYEHFLRNVYEADFHRYLIENGFIEEKEEKSTLDKLKFIELAQSKVGTEYHKRRKKVFLFEDNFYSYKYVSGPPNPIVIHRWDYTEVAEFLNESLRKKSRFRKLIETIIN